MRQRLQLGSIAACLFALCCGFPGPAAAVVPETGLYWDYQHPGKGYYVEHQNGQVLLVIYSFNENTGEPLFYTASGPLRNDAIGSGTLEPPVWDEGYFPLHGVKA